VLKASDFQELVDAAITMEDDFKQVQEERRKKAKLEPKGTPENKVTPNLQFKSRFMTGGDERP
jgi:rRNA maturation protein Rpf1